VTRPHLLYQRRHAGDAAGRHIDALPGMVRVGDGHAAGGRQQVAVQVVDCQDGDSDSGRKWRGRRLRAQGQQRQ